MSGDEWSPFGPPDFASPVVLDEYVRDCPASATTRGTFFEYVEKLTKEKLGRTDERLYEHVESRRWMPFKSYPMVDFIRICHNAARLVYPLVPIGEALRRVGWICFPSFAGTMAGRVVLFAFGQRLEDVVVAAPNAYALGVPGSRVKSEMTGPRRCRVELRDVHNFATTYQVGVIEGAIRGFGFVPTVLIRTPRDPDRRRHDADFDVQW